MRAAQDRIVQDARHFVRRRLMAKENKENIRQKKKERKGKSPKTKSTVGEMQTGRPEERHIYDPARGQIASRFGAGMTCRKRTSLDLLPLVGRCTCMQDVRIGRRL